MAANYILARAPVFDSTGWCLLPGTRGIISIETDIYRLGQEDEHWCVLLRRSRCSRYNAFSMAGLSIHTVAALSSGDKQAEILGYDRGASLSNLFDVRDTIWKIAVLCSVAALSIAISMWKNLSPGVLAWTSFVQFSLRSGIFFPLGEFYLAMITAWLWPK